jgi:hypothetical protein
MRQGNEKAGMLAHTGPHSRRSEFPNRLFLDGLLLSRARLRFAGFINYTQSSTKWF